jgi:Mu-like prophage protein Com.
MNFDDLPEIRCPKCNKIIARGVLEKGLLELKCYTTRCGTKILLRASRPNIALLDGLHGDRYAREHSSSQS